MALHLHRAERTDLLADGLGALLSNPLPDSLLSVNGFGGWEPHTMASIAQRVMLSNMIAGREGSMPARPASR